MAEELKPCPFCGGEAHIDSDYSSELDHTFWQVWHDCSTNPGPIRHTYGHALGMEISTPWCASEDAAVDLWNRRAGTTCEQRLEKLAHDAAVELTGIDRDALLALAEDVDGAADDSGGFEPLAGMLRDIAHRIREALGVES